jgi:hypothetical protein
VTLPAQRVLLALIDRGMGRGLSRADNPAGFALAYRGTQGVAVLALVFVAIGIAIIWSVPDDQSEAHGINYILPVAFVVGGVAALLLRKTGSVWPGVIVHATNNAYSIVVPAAPRGAVLTAS